MKIFKFFSLLCVMSLLLFISCKTTTSTTNDDQLENSLLWKVSGKNIQQPSYIYGTIHLTCDYKLTDKMKKAFEQTDQLALEIDISDMTKLQAEMMRMIYMEDGKTIKGMLSEEEYATLNTFFKKTVGMDLMMFNTMKPMLASSMLISKMSTCDDAVAYESEFVKIAQAAKEEIVALETVADQMKAFDKIPYEQQLKSLVEMAKKGLDKSKEEFKQMATYYNNEDLNGLLKFSSENGLEGDFEQSLVDQRNRNWIPLIAEIAAEKPTFFGVGALHLPGDQGVINLLRKAGYTVEAVR